MSMLLQKWQDSFNQARSIQNINGERDTMPTLTARLTAFY